LGQAIERIVLERLAGGMDAVGDRADIADRIKAVGKILQGLQRGAMEARRRVKGWEAELEGSEKAQDEGGVAQPSAPSLMFTG